VDQSKFKAILKKLSIFSLKVALGFLLLVLVLLLLVHTPPIQKRITAKVSSYLSATTRGKVDIEEIRFSLWGEIVVKGFVVIDPEGNSLLSAQKLAVRPDIMLLLSGNLAFADVDMAGVNFHLLNTTEGLNIQFIIDAFTPKERPPSSDKKKFSIQVTRVNFENVHFEYQSKIDSVDLAIKLGILKADDFALSISPNKIRSTKIYLEQTKVTTISSQKPQKAESPKLFPLDFGSGFDFEVGTIELKDNYVAFHVGEILETQRFDPNHLVLSDVQLQLNDLFVREDSLSVEVQQFTAELPDFSLSGFRAKFHSNLKQLVLSDLFLSTDDSEVRLDALASYDHWPNLLNDLDKANLELSILANIHPGDLLYFLNDTILSVVEHWPPIELDINGRLSSGTVEIDTASIVVGNSALLVNGTMKNLQDPAGRSWENVSINTMIGPTFRSLATPYIGNFKLPQALNFQLTSSGNLNSFYVESQINSSSGDVKAQGKAGLKQNALAVDFMIDGDKVDLGGLMDVSWLGPIDLSLHAVGNANNSTSMVVSGQIEKMQISDNEIKDIEVQSNIDLNSASVTLLIMDPDYRSKILSEIQFEGPFSINSSLQLDDFSLGKLLHQDTILLVSGDINSKISIDQSDMEGFLKGQNISLKTQSTNYLMDSLALDLMISPTISAINLYSDDMNGVLEANFDIQKGSEVVGDLFRNYWSLSDSIQNILKDRRFNFSLEVEDAAPLQFFNNQIKDFAELHISGNFHENDQALKIEAETHKFNGFGISLDTLKVNFDVLQNNINSNLQVENISYDSVRIGNLDFHIRNNGDSIFSNFALYRDSISLLNINTHFKPTENGRAIYLDNLISFNRELNINRNNPVFWVDNNLVFKDFIVSRGDLEIEIDGDLNKFDLSINNADLRNLNYLLAQDSAVIDYGNLDGFVSYAKVDNQINIQAAIDSLTFKNTPPINITAKAITEDVRVPIEFSLKSATNNIELAGDYFINNSEIDALLKLDINDLEMFQFLFSGKMEEMSGSVNGQTRITGTLLEPKYQGSLRFTDVDLTTSKPRSTFQLRDETISLNNSGIKLDNFTIYDQWENPLILNGALKTEDYQSFEYDLTLDTDHYLLLNNPSTEEYPIQGTLVVGSNLKLKGNEKDTYVEANIIVRDTTELTIVIPQKDLELITNEGIVEFIDPEQSNDSIHISQTQSFYDSLIATLPNFNLTSAITLEDEAVFRVIVDARSGDYVEASGAAELELSFDRTGNIQLEGSYSITKGFYQLSFYDLAKKKFIIVPGSNINWTGNPNNGDLDIQALYTIKTSSIGLIGHEIGENEKAVYRKSLPYQIGIVITGNIENPQISFSLDLPEEEKVNYPALANKLDRFKQPEFESELNKQVFGLLVLGGFIPESSGSDFDQSLIATTALSNSVNSILASQFNRFASQIIRGVDIDIGLQSYSDYSTGSGKTRTAMDFRVTKRLMDDRLSIEVGGGLDINAEQSGVNTGGDSFRGDITVIYDLTESGAKQLKVFNNETYDIIYHEIRNTGISLIFIKEFDKDQKRSE